MAHVLTEGECCVDCLTMIANGDDSGMTPERSAEVQKAIGECGGYPVASCGDDCEGGFSWSPCDLCGSRLGGERHPFAVLST